ncbi:LPXTG cell wall anchor domain-containing protein [Roseateles sp. SL47]|uniref:LPXTG cell wall anchor domain-containing protein n=1 Tax=Roseateles sp. SL47 TaxID=2995138 RepID=UPI00226F9E4C|nr:LPXTG cell wall anchor domain-containing protein [Roseateles sp. SL47]WAC73570.1 LPXTG cell wall anchor domain-containing protein [Roseateles sp. SL47]
MKAVVALGLVLLSLTAQAREQQVQTPLTSVGRAAPQLAAEPVVADTSFSQRSQSEPVQLPDVNEQEGVDSLLPSFTNESQTQALMLGGLLAMGFLVRRRREE